jgi:hypothetical protein
MDNPATPAFTEAAGVAVVIDAVLPRWFQVASAAGPPDLEVGSVALS